jgi:hypothetical protein
LDVLQGKALTARTRDGQLVMPPERLLRMREANMLVGRGPGLSRAQRCHIGGFLYRPNEAVSMIDRMQSRAYIGQFSRDGDVFFGARPLFPKPYIIALHSISLVVRVQMAFQCVAERA